MNRTVWIARFVAVVILVLFALLMANLHRKLRDMQQNAPPPASTTTR